VSCDGEELALAKGDAAFIAAREQNNLAGNITLNGTFTLYSAAANLKIENLY
jgi:hypothetical protein